VKVEETLELDSIKTEYQVPVALQSCHTAIVNGYVIEGHVPVEEIVRLLEERPDVIGLAVAGMPPTSPGMDLVGFENDPYDVMVFSENGESEVFASYPK
jgi:hypothetical protein